MCGPFAQVDVEGISTADELLRGLRAAYVHYTNHSSPPAGSLITSVVLMGGDGEVHLLENSAVSLRPPLAAILPCSCIVMQGFPTSLIASQNYHLKVRAEVEGLGLGWSRSSFSR